MNKDPRETLSTADLANATDTREQRQETTRQMTRDARAPRTEGRIIEHDDERHVADRPTEEKLAALFPPKTGEEFRARWDKVQLSFVDDPKRAVREGDELVAEVMKCLAQSFSQERTRLEQQLGQNDASSTENLRMALRRYRSFFHRLLSL
jgi:hypothetical protein